MTVLSMKSTETLLAKFTATIDEHDGTAVIRIPDRELELGTVSVGDKYRISLLDPAPADSANTSPHHNDRSHRPATSPPVEEGEQLDVEIEDIGERGDGIARVGPGYVIFVPGTDLGDRVTIEVTRTRERFGFAEVVTPEPIAG